MRYLVAIFFAIGGAALAFAMASGPIADWTVARQTFESSDDAENLHQMAFMAVNLIGLIIGWTIGWALGAKLGEDDGSAK
jgi:hypothetical protein